MPGAYDIGGRLRQVTQTAKNSAGANTTQNRFFTYDNRGLLLSEIHPEKGTSGNGPVSYLSYDARGHAGRILDGPNDLTFSFDGAERLTQIRETGGGFLGCVATWTSGPRCLKTFAYATGNGTGDWRLGKLQTATRYNYPVIGAATYTVVSVLVLDHEERGAQESALYDAGLVFNLEDGRRFALASRQSILGGLECSTDQGVIAELMREWTVRIGLE